MTSGNSSVFDAGRLSHLHLIFSVLLIVAGLRPYPRAALGWGLTERVSDLVLLLFITAALVYFVYRNDWRLELSKSSGTVLQLFALLAVLASVSLVLSPVRILSDTFEVFRFMMYACLFLAGVALRWRPRQVAVYIMLPLIAITALQIPLAIGQYFRVDGVLYLLQWYTSERHLLSTRSVGMFFNPYMFAIFLIFPFAYFTHRLISTRDVMAQIASATFVVFLLAAILLTQSRSVMIVLGGTAVYIGILLSVASRPLFKRYVLVAGSVFGIGAIGVLLFFDLTYLSTGFRSILEGGIRNVGSAEARFERYRYLLSLSVERPLIGWGPAKSLSPTIENNYLLHLFRYGVLGLLSFFLLFSMFALKTFRVYWGCEQRVSEQSTSFYFAMHVWLVALLAGSLSNDFIANPRIYPFLFLLLGVVYSTARVNSHKGSETGPMKRDGKGLPR